MKASKFFGCLFVMICLSINLVWAQKVEITDFTVKENLSQNGKLAIIAIDSAGKTNNEVNGNYAFNINGFKQEPVFTDGVAVIPSPIESTTVVFFKYKGETKSLGKLFLLRMTDKGIVPYKLSGFLLLVLPLIILYIAYKFKRLLITVIVLAVIYLYLNQSKGLNVMEIVESTILTLKNLIF